jgi:hypothetical protein
MLKRVGGSKEQTGKHFYHDYSTIPTVDDNYRRTGKTIKDKK